MQAGQRMVRVRSPRESSTIVSVLSPVETALPKVGQRIMISGITREALTRDTFPAAQLHQHQMEIAAKVGTAPASTRRAMSLVSSLMNIIEVRLGLRDLQIGPAAPGACCSSPRTCIWVPTRPDVVVIPAKEPSHPSPNLQTGRAPARYHTETAFFERVCCVARVRNWPEGEVNGCPLARQLSGVKRARYARFELFSRPICN
jgi:hypothetical protein